MSKIVHLTDCEQFTVVSQEGTEYVKKNTPRLMIPNRLTGSFTTQRINFVGAPQCLKNQKVLFSESYLELGFQHHIHCLYNEADRLTN